jgi:hypothetical protein
MKSSLPRQALKLLFNKFQAELEWFLATLLVPGEKESTKD